jgi:hypothetical protein
MSEMPQFRSQKQTVVIGSYILFLMNFHKSHLFNLSMLDEYETNPIKEHEEPVGPPGSENGHWFDK